jgi:hypothetical protein
LLLAYPAVSNPDNIYLHTSNDGFSPILEINYTPPASDGKSTVVNIQENCNFNRATNSTGAFSMEPYGFNNWFGGYTQPTYAILSSPPAGGTAPPYGGKMLEVVAGAGRPMVHCGLPILEDGEWYNYSAYVYIPATAPADMAAEFTFLGDKAGPNATTTKGQWIRHNVGFIANASEAQWGIVQGNGSTWNSTAKFYVANVQLTKGRYVRAYIDGNRTMTDATYGWAGLNVNGFVRAVPPTITLPAQANKARRKYYAVNWTYTANTGGHAQELVEIQVGRNKH